MTADTIKSYCEGGHRVYVGIRDPTRMNCPELEPRLLNPQSSVMFQATAVPCNNFVTWSYHVTLKITSAPLKLPAWLESTHPASAQPREKFVTHCRTSRQPWAVCVLGDASRWKAKCRSLSCRWLVLLRPDKLKLTFTVWCWPDLSLFSKAHYDVNWVTLLILTRPRKNFSYQYQQKVDQTKDDNKGTYQLEF